MIARWLTRQWCKRCRGSLFPGDVVCNWCGAPVPENGPR